LNIGLQNRKRDDSRKDAKHAKFGEMENISSLRSWRPFGFAQDMLGARKLLEVVLSNISDERS
jgi:hypothetical protein